MILTLSPPSSNKESRDFMISLLTIGAIDATRGACERTGYHEPVQGGIGCPDPDHTGLTYKRDPFAVPYKDPSPDYYIEEDASHLRARISDGQVDKPERWCNYVTNMCAGPKTLCKFPDLACSHDYLWNPCSCVPHPS
jgi:hypothetical protein